MATLVVTDGPAASRVFALERHRLVMVGREEDCTFQILDDHVSRRHLQVKYDEGSDHHFAIDAGSANGVRVNDRPVMAGEERQLEDGDRIAIGESVIVYTRTDHADAEQAMRAVRMLGERRRETLGD